MTDLERVRDFVLAMADAEMLDIIDAHLTADAEADRMYDEQKAELTRLREGFGPAYQAKLDRVDELEAENDRLRKERDKLHKLYNRAQDDASREAEIRVNQGFELARLREENQAKDISVLNLAAEVDRLREADEVHWKTRRHLVGELARLREALRIIAKNGSYSDALLAAEALRGESDG